MLAGVRGVVIGTLPDNSILLEVGPITLQIAMSHTTLASLPRDGTPTRLVTHLYIREDQLALYGFSTETELGHSGCGDHRRHDRRGTRPRGPAPDGAAEVGRRQRGTIPIASFCPLPSALCLLPPKEATMFIATCWLIAALALLWVIVRTTD